MLRFLRFFTVAFLFVLPLCAQNPTGRITGRVTDPTGAVVPGATVKGVNIATNVEASTTTTSEGNFALLNLIPGQYRLQATMAGFKNFEQGPIELHVGDTLTIPVTMQVGAQTESVTVNAEAPLLEAGTAQLGQVVTTKQMQNLPMPESSALFIAMFAANLTTTSPVENLYDPSAREKPMNVNAAGAMQSQNVAMMDGMPNMIGPQSVANLPTAEMVQEVKVSVADYDASQGHYTGALVNMVMKTGTNDLHGILTYYHNGTALNAVPYFTKISLAQQAPVTHEKLRKTLPYKVFNRYRGTFTGPVVIPKLYDGHNKTFFSFSGDYYLMPYGGTGLFTVPTLKQRNGDFSELLAVGSNYQIYDPYSAKQTADGHITRSPVPGNIIPQDKLNPVARNLLNLYPTPNLPGNADKTQNWTGAPFSTIDWRDFWWRVDHNVADNHRLYFSYNLYRCLATQNIYLGKPFKGYGDIYPTGVIQDNHHDAGTLDDVINLSNSTVLNLRYGFIRFKSRQPSVSNGIDLAAIGFNPQLINLVPKELIHLPSMSISGYQGIGSGTGSLSTSTNQNFFASVTQMRGNHSLKFGTEVRWYQRAGNSYGNLLPSYTFGTDWLKASDTANASPIGQGLASFMYGLPTDGSRSNNASSAVMSKMFAWYVHDDWKVTRKLTVNLGIRHELEFPTTERYNRTTRGFSYNDPNPVQAAAQANYALNPIDQIPASQFKVPGGLMFAGVNGNPRGIFGLQKLNFMPRIGLAYQWDSKTVVRAGYGIFFESLEPAFQGINQTGFSLATSMLPSIDDGLNFRFNLGGYPFPDGFLVPAGASAGLTTNLGGSVTFTNPAKYQGYSQRWSLNIQRQIGARTLIQLGYVGNRANHITSPTSNSSYWNSLPVQYLSRLPVRDAATISALGKIVPNPFYGIPQFAKTSLGNPTTTVAQLLLPFPQFNGTDGVRSTENDGFSWYHGVSVHGERRFANGFSVQANYTWSKMMQAVDRLNGIQSPLAHSISQYDRPHVFNVNGVWDLPFGKGQPLLSSLPKWANYIVGDWSVSALYVAQSGQAMNFGNVLFTGDLSDIPLPRSQRTVDRFFNTDAGFNKNSPQQLDRNYRTFPQYLTGARNPGWNDWSVSPIKKFALREKLNLEVRGQLTNAFNHPNFGGPNLSPTSSSFGKITSSTARTISLQGQLQW